MQIRKFEADSFEQALSRVKAELGPDALILASEEKRRGWFHKPVVEITAGVDASQAEFPQALDLAKIFPHRKEVGREQERERAQTEQRSQSAPLPPASRVPASGLATDKIEANLLEVGIEPESARDLARQIVLDYPRKDREDPKSRDRILCRVLASGIKTLDPGVFQSRRSWAAMGAEGAGKTSLLVKLALSLTSRGQKVALASCDRRKIVGRQELAAYAKLIGVPFQAALDAERNPGQVLLLDTPSACESVQSSASEVARDLERQCRDFSTVLVLDCSQRLHELLRVVDRHARFAPVALAFTRTDTVEQLGVIYDVLRRTKLPLLGISAGVGFKDGFAFMEPAALARRIFSRPGSEQRQQALIDSAQAAAGARFERGGEQWLG